MLVFELNWEEHIKNDPGKGCKRSGIDFKWLVEVVAEINLYLPDDWRMTRTTNNFRVNVVSEDKAIALAGYSYLIKGGNILNIIDSIHPKEHIDIIDARRSKENKFDASFKKKYPPTPNLYFFIPRPENSVTPLFARQYERLKRKKDGTWVGDQYHRIHPLTKEGLDLTHYHWVRWTINGDVEFVENVPQGYHGKDFWEIPLLGKKRANHKSYIDTYNKILKELGITLPKGTEKAFTPYEVEYKFLIPGSEDDARAAFERVETSICESGFLIKNFAGKAKEQIDTYFDDEKFSLHEAGAAFRVRHKNKTIWVTLKKRLPLRKRYSEEGLYQRIKEEATITRVQEEELLRGKPINVFPYRLLPYVAPYCKNVKPVVKVINNRKTLNLKDKEHREAELCLDEVMYNMNGKKHGPYYEIEIESKGSPRNEIKKLASYLEKNLGLVPSYQSKYERGISLFKIAQVTAKDKRKVIIDTDCGVDDALALILALKSPELQVLAITTVSGNVHVNKVNENVFKVLSQLNLENTPLVAKGADKPLKTKRIEAESVHGSDGLGDVDWISSPGNMQFDRRPAWKVICDLARENRNEITLITVGPMTNLALAIEKDPEGVHCLKEVVAMGGVFFDVGNVAPDAEFNVRADPDATRKVVEFCKGTCLKLAVDKNGKIVNLPPDPTEKDFEKVHHFEDRNPDKYGDMVPLTFVGLDVTHRVVLRRATVDRLVESHPDNKLLKFVKDISRKYMEFYYGNEGLDGCYLHDPLAVAYVINPFFLEIEKHIIHVETAGSFTNGVIFPDDRPTTNWTWRNPAEEVIGIARRVEREAFEEFLIARLVK